MGIRSFVIAYALVLALLLFADRRPVSTQQDRYSHVVDLTASTLNERSNAKTPFSETADTDATRIIAPAALIPGTWSAGQIPAERLIAPMVVMNLKTSQITLDDIEGWEAKNGMIPQGSFVAIRHQASAVGVGKAQMPITSGAAQFLMDARYVLGFAIDTPADLGSDRTLARQLALHGDYVVENTARMTSLPEAGSLIIVAPAKTHSASEVPVRVLAMVR